MTTQTLARCLVALALLAACPLDTFGVSDSATTNRGTTSGSNTESEASSAPTDPSSNTDSSSITDSSSASETLGGQHCTDADGDGHGGPMNCMNEPFPGSAPNADDCDDTHPGTFPGAAELDSETACMTDTDEDGHGDDNPLPGVDPGTDCDDASAVTFPGAAELDDAMACMRDEDGDGYGDDTPSESGVLPGTDCDDDNTSTFPGSAPLDDPEACMTDEDDDDYGGDDPGPGVVPGTDCADQDALEHEMCAVCEPDLPFDADACAVHDYDFTPNSDPVASWMWDGQTVCETVNAKDSALFCGWTLDNATITGSFAVNTASDDDWIGFVWGLQDSDHFYLFTWKGAGQVANVCGPAPFMVPGGMQVKRIAAEDPQNTPLDCPDLLAPNDTDNSTLLLSVAEFSTTPWVDFVDYTLELTHESDGDMSITVRDTMTMALVATTTFHDATYPGGEFGIYTKSQSQLCFHDFTLDCL